MIRSGFVAVALVATLAGTGCASGGGRNVSTSSAASSTSSAAAPIAWHAWGDSAFEQARAEDKLVLVDVGIEGCTACRWMYEETYKAAPIAARVGASFVAVAIDADVQPDLGARFERWGWPATIVMTAKGEQVLALRGSRSPEVFARILDDVVKKKKEGSLRPDADEADEADETRSAPPASSTKTALRDTCVRITRAIDADMNPKHGGWTDEGPQYIQGPAIEEAFLRAHVERRPELRAHALKTLDGYAKLLDPVWGGVFVAAHDVDFTGVIVEKRLVQEAEALASFATAYAATRDETWRRRAGEIDRYVEGFLLAPDGTFYSTQQDEAPALPAKMSSTEYFGLSDAERRKFGVPPVDHAVYTDQNAQAIQAYAALYEATGDARMLARATRAAGVLAARVQAPGGFVLQAGPTDELATDTRKRAFRPLAVPYLTAQAHFANALLALHRVTGEPRWLESARGIVAAARASLEDREAGGFFASTSTKDKPVYENVVAARALHALAVYTHDDSLDRAAERTLRAVSASRGAIVALAIQDLALGPIELSVAGKRDDPRATALYAAALGVYEPRKAVHYDDAKRYPDRGRPALYACTRTSCSSPVYDPARVAATVASVAEARRSACE